MCAGWLHLKHSRPLAMSTSIDAALLLCTSALPVLKTCVANQPTSTLKVLR